MTLLHGRQLMLAIGWEYRQDASGSTRLLYHLAPIMWLQLLPAQGLGFKKEHNKCAKTSALKAGTQ